MLVYFTKIKNFKKILYSVFVTRDCEFCFFQESNSLDIKLGGFHVYSL